MVFGLVLTTELSGVLKPRYCVHIDLRGVHIRGFTVPTLFSWIVCTPEYL